MLLVLLQHRHAHHLLVLEIRTHTHAALLTPPHLHLPSAHGSCLCLLPMCLLPFLPCAICSAYNLSQLVQLGVGGLQTSLGRALSKKQFSVSFDGLAMPVSAAARCRKDDARASSAGDAIKNSAYRAGIRLWWCRLGCRPGCFQHQRCGGSCSGSHH